MLNEDLEVVDVFSTFIKAQLGKKLHSRVKELTNITNVAETVWEMDYTKVNEILEKEREKSIEYLKKQLI